MKPRGLTAATLIMCVLNVTGYLFLEGSGMPAPFAATFFSAIIANGIKRGVFREMDVKTPCWMLINTGLGYAMVTLNLSPFETFNVEDAIEFILRGLKA